MHVLALSIIALHAPPVEAIDLFPDGNKGPT